MDLLLPAFVYNWITNATPGRFIAFSLFFPFSFPFILSWGSTSSLDRRIYL